MSVAQFSRFFVLLVCDESCRRLTQLHPISLEVYFCGRENDRLLRIALTHCQHAAVAEGEIDQAPRFEVPGGLWLHAGVAQAANVALRLLEAKVRGCC